MVKNVEDQIPDVSRETLDQLEEFSRLLAKWTRSINLIAPSTIEDIWQRHIIDSAQIFRLAPANWRNWIDLGSGGGLPGIVVAIMDVKKRPITLVESDRRKSIFLKTAARELDLNVTVVNERIEDAELCTAHIVSARALAPLSSLIELAYPILDKDGVCLFPKGANYKQEFDNALDFWKFDAETYLSETDSAARILKISKVVPCE